MMFGSTRVRGVRGCPQNLLQSELFLVIESREVEQQSDIPAFSPL
ncbi:hypothetical protein [Candidatus Parabeggiatoa sp. HSG14]|nr:hypothetical protein [Thiotrichales bacterium HSG14]